MARQQKLIELDKNVKRERERERESRFPNAEHVLITKVNMNFSKSTFPVCGYSQNLMAQTFKS
jgi:hypothetical protein